MDNKTGHIKNLISDSVEVGDDEVNTVVKPKLLAPAGSFEALEAALKSGADEVYLGGPKFGARAFAENFTKTQMSEALELAHNYGSNIHMTVNTLMKELEMEEIKEYLLPFYVLGVDALIIQDMGVFSKIHEWFPDWELHASTQMGITSKYGATLLKDMGAKRVVLARELSYEEICEITAIPDLEVECFIHGALCYGYSGHCMLSSAIGSRSGNRGRCGQACRLEYTCGNDRGYFLAPKDLCTIKSLPDYIRAGVNSLKIEGRMKSSEYVETVVSIYRYYLDKAYDSVVNGTEYKVLDEDILELSQIYSRGGFTSGYLHQKNGKEMMSVKRPNHQGVKVGEVAEIKNGAVHFKALTNIYKDDYIELEYKGKIYKLTCPVEFAKGSMAQLNISGSKELKPGLPLYRMKSHFLIEEREKFIEDTGKIPVQVEIILKKDDYAEINVINLYNGEDGGVIGDEVQKAENRAVTEEQVIKAFGSLGDTRFYIENMDIDMDDDIFIPMKEIKELRRGAIKSLERAVKPDLGSIKREIIKMEMGSDK